jgi:hypothetical protein
MLIRSTRSQTNPWAFRHAFYSEFVLLGIWLVPCIILPESPVWLSRKGYHDKAKKSLRFLIGNVEGYDLEHEYAVLQREISESDRMLGADGNKSSQWLLVLKGTNLKRTLISALPLCIQVRHEWRRENLGGES